MENSITKILKNLNLLQFVGKISVQSVINPLLWLCGITIPLAVGGFIFTTRIEMVYLAFTPVIFVGGAYLFFMFNNPDFLRSEKYQLEKRSMELMGEKDKELPSGKVVELKALPKPAKTKRDSSRRKKAK